MKLLKLLSVLLDYPQDELWQHRDELLAAADDPVLTPGRSTALRTFIATVLDSEPMVAQATWLSLFDRGRSMSLLLFEHIHGQSRDRGQAMVDLLATYQRNGFSVEARELPDYLPLLLEYLALRPREEVLDWLHHIHHIIGLLAARADERKSAYSLLFQILVEISEGELDLETWRRCAREETRDDTVEMMDRLWEEETIRFSKSAADEWSDRTHSFTNRRTAT